MAFPSKTASIKSLCNSWTFSSVILWIVGCPAFSNTKVVAKCIIDFSTIIKFWFWKLIPFAYSDSISLKSSSAFYRLVPWHQISPKIYNLKIDNMLFWFSSWGSSNFKKTVINLDRLLLGKLIYFQFMSYLNIAANDSNVTLRLNDY